jgi:phage portal protein BeeE
VEIIERGANGSDSALYIEGRNASKMDIAAFFNLPASVLDATSATASLTYVTQEGNRSSLDDMTLPYWIGPIASRLSQDDIVPAGQSVRFDFSSRGGTPITTED